jgi:hypothetical protein
VLDRSFLVELIKLILKHGAHATRTVATVAEATTALAAWQPHVVIKLGELEIDILNRTVLAGTSELHLTSLEQSPAVSACGQR